MFTGEEETGGEGEVAPAEGTQGTEEETTEGEDNSDNADGDASQGEADATKDAEDEEPPTRKPKTNADWVALRRQKKLEKVTKANEQGEDDKDDDANDDLDDVSEEDAKVIDKVLSRRLAPIEQERYENQLKGEINDFVATNPQFAPFTEKALKWAKHPSWKDIPTKQLMFAVAGEKLLKMGATLEKQAIVKARATKTGTNGGGNATGTKPVSEMTDAEFAQEVERVKYGSK